MLESRRFLFVLWDGGGNVPPELSLARRLVARRHSVRVLADPTIEPEARAIGCEFSAWTTAPHRASRERAHDLFKDYEISSPLEMIDRYIEEFLAEPAPRWAGDTLAELRARPVDLVVADVALPAALIAAQVSQTPAVSLMPNIWIIPTPGIPPMGPGFLPARNVIGRARDAVLRALVKRSFQKAVPALNAVRIAHGLAPVRDFYEQLLGAEQVLVQTSPVFDFTSPHMPAKVRYIGPALDDPEWSNTAGDALAGDTPAVETKRGKPSALIGSAAPRWQSPFAPDDRRPLVLVGLSSTFQDQVATLGRITQALANLPVRALITLGPALDPAEVTGRSNVVVVRAAPHSQVLEHAALLITHCGHGTTMKGLAAGVPLVCLPMGRDQNDTAARVVHAGAGVRLSPRASARRIAAAIGRVLDDGSYRRAAARLARAIATHEGCVDGVALLEQAAWTNGPPSSANGRVDTAPVTS
jgi:UDP:flavonoid glycosyltransferase YjiC (YdhE family)